MRTSYRRLVEWILIVSIIAAICGIAVPILAKSITEARSVTAKQNLAAAEQAIDIAMLDGSRVNVDSLEQSFSGIQWLEYKGQNLKDCTRSKEGQSIYFARLHSGALCIFAIPTDGSLIYSIYSNGAWRQGEKTEHSTSLPAFILSLK